MDLIAAIRAGDHGRLRALLSAGADPAACSGYGRTPLHAAVEEGDLEAVRILLEAGAPVSASARVGGDQPLHVAAAYASIYDLDDPERPGPLDQPHSTSPAVAQVLLEALQERYASLPSGMALRDELPPGTKGDVFMGLLELVGKRDSRLSLLERFEAAGVDLDREDPVWAELLRGKPRFLEIARALLDAGADPQAHNRSGETPLHFAAASGEPEMVSLLLERGARADQPGFQAALERGLLEVADRLAATGVVPSGSLLSHLAAQGQADSVQWLLDRGVCPDEPDEEGCLPVVAALGAGHLRMAQALVQAGARLPAEALLAAAEHGFRPAVDWCLERGLPVDARDSQGNTPLHLACRSGCPLCCQALLQAGASPNVRARDGSTPLHRACQEEPRETGLIPLLLEAGADPAVVDDTGRTPADVARAFGHPAWVLEQLTV
ncbi:MAG: ankyrin repeat domain-containing protein [Candidatus Eremiobacterota bacterium]